VGERADQLLDGMIVERPAGAASVDRLLVAGDRAVPVVGREPVLAAAERLIRCVPGRSRGGEIEELGELGGGRGPGVLAGRPARRWVEDQQRRITEDRVLGEERRVRRDIVVEIEPDELSGVAPEGRAAQRGPQEPAGVSPGRPDLDDQRQLAVHRLLPRGLIVIIEPAHGPRRAARDDGEGGDDGGGGGIAMHAEGMPAGPCVHQTIATSGRFGAVSGRGAALTAASSRSSRSGWMRTITPPLDATR
jgi:hypothetical protein